jgi:hypothetical protein
LFRVSLAPAAPEEGLRECLLISDIHFDPFADPSLFESLAREPASEWGRLLASSSERGVSQLGTDSNYVLLESCLTAAAQTCPRPEFILYPGDSLARDYERATKRLRSVLAATAKRRIASSHVKVLNSLPWSFGSIFPVFPFCLLSATKMPFAATTRSSPRGNF